MLPGGIQYTLLERCQRVHQWRKQWAPVTKHLMFEESKNVSREHQGVDEKEKEKKRGIVYTVPYGMACN